MIEKIYIKNINIEERDFIKKILAMHPIPYIVNKDTVTIFKAPKGLYEDLVEFKKDLEKEGKTIIIYTE